MRPSVPRLTCCTRRLIAQKRRQNRFCKIEPSLVTDSSEASKDGCEASDGRSDVGGAWSAQPALCLNAPGRARALWGSRTLTRK